MVLACATIGTAGLSLSANAAEAEAQSSGTYDVFSWRPEYRSSADAKKAAIKLQNELNNYGKKNEVKPGNKAYASYSRCGTCDIRSHLPYSSAAYAKLGHDPISYVGDLNYDEKITYADLACMASMFGISSDAIIVKYYPYESCNYKGCVEMYYKDGKCVAERRYDIDGDGVLTGKDYNALKSFLKSGGKDAKSNVGSTAVVISKGWQTTKGNERYKTFTYEMYPGVDGTRRCTVDCTLGR